MIRVSIMNALLTMISILAQSIWWQSDILFRNSYTGDKDLHNWFRNGFVLDYR